MISEIIAWCVLGVIVLLFLPLMLGFCVLPDWEERAPVTEHKCIVLSANMNYRKSKTEGKNGKGGKTFIKGHVPVVQVRLVVSNTTHWAMRYRRRASGFNGQGYSRFDCDQEARAFLEKFSEGESVPCYQFEDGTVKLEEGPPELQSGTRAAYVLSSLASAMLCFVTWRSCSRCCCRSRATDRNITPKKKDIEVSTSDLESVHVDTLREQPMWTQFGRPHIKTEG
jgi:hypothetical protein